MNTYTITIERISTGERSDLLFRGLNEDAARAHGEEAIRQSVDADDFRVVEINARR